MQTDIDRHSDTIAVIRVQGRLDFLSAADAKETITSLVSAGTNNLVIDLTSTEFIDSSGLGSLIGGLKAARQAGGDLRIANPSDQVRSVLRLTSLDRVFQSHPTVDDALSAFER